MKSPLYDSNADDDHNPNIGLLPKAFDFPSGFCYSNQVIKFESQPDKTIQTGYKATPMKV